MIAPPEPPKSAFDYTADELGKFSLVKLWKTFVLVTRPVLAFWILNWSKHDDKIETMASAIGKQDWSLIVPPFRYLGVTSGVCLLSGWVLNSLINGVTTKPVMFDILDPFFLQALLWALASALPLHFLLGAGRYSEERVDGILDGTLKIIHLYLYGIGTIFVIVTPIALFYGLPDLYQESWIVSDLALTYEIMSGILTFTIFIFTIFIFTIPKILSRLYGVDPLWGGVFAWLRSLLSLGRFTFLSRPASLLRLGRTHSAAKKASC